MSIITCVYCVSGCVSRHPRGHMCVHTHTKSVPGPRERDSTSGRNFASYGKMTHNVSGAISSDPRQILVNNLTALFQRSFEQSVLKTRSQQPLPTRESERAVMPPRLARRRRLTRGLPARGHPRPTARARGGEGRCLWPPWQAGAYPRPGRGRLCPEAEATRSDTPNPTRQARHVCAGPTGMTTRKQRPRVKF